jgi:DNA-binding protein HU-beta
MEFVDADEKVTLKGIGSIQRTVKEARDGRNPATGETVAIPSKSVLKFKADKATVIVIKPAKKAAKK